MTPARLFVMAGLSAALLGCGADVSRTARGAASPPPAAVSADRPPVPDEVRRRQTIAVYPFDNHAVTGRERLGFLAEWLPDVIAGALADAGELRVVERRSLLRILEEQKLGASELASKETRIRLGRMAGAQTLVFGGFTAVGDSLQLDARLVDAESGLVVRSATARGTPAEARDLGLRLAGDIASGLGLELTRRITAAGVTGDRALEAAEHYYRGLALEKNGEIEQAIESYRKALEINRDDDEARRRLKKLLGGR